LARPVASWIFFPGRLKQLVGNAHLDVIGLAGEHRQRFVLRLPAEPSDRAVVAAAVRVPSDAEGSSLLGGRSILREDLAVWDSVDQSYAEHRCGNTEGEIALGELSGEIGLRQRALWNGRIVINTANRPESMNPTIARAVSAVPETHFPDRAVLLF